MTNTLFTRSSLGFARVAAVSPELRVADCAFNAQAIIAALRECKTRGAQLAAFPELCLTGYTCGDLFFQTALLDGALAALDRIAEETLRLNMACVVGLPILLEGRLFNCAAFVCAGRVMGLVPKTYLPTYNEFYEGRWFASARELPRAEVEIIGERVPITPRQIFAASNMPGFALGIEICEDVWAVNPPSGDLALAGATLIVNPSASPETLGKMEYRRELVKQQSARCLAAYVYAASGPGESSSDLVFSGHSLICENGALLAESARFEFGAQMILADVDVQRLTHERMNNSSFRGAGGWVENTYPILNTQYFNLPDVDAAPQTPLARPLAQNPFVPQDKTQRAKNCREIFNIQSTGLAKRLRHTGVKTVTIGISGGLDSTLALLVAIRAFDTLALPRAGIIAITMPGFGTTDRTYGNALAMMKALGVTAREIPIRQAVLQHFADIGHDPATHDVTYENAQARERTQILMDVANKSGGFVVGTGDLSELALGWLTFNGDHMSMYHVNAGVPKTLVRYMVKWCADEEFGGEVSAVLRDIAATPITPELLPLKDGQLQQKTEDTVGPYILHDFFLYYAVRYGFAPRKVFYLAREAFDPNAKWKMQNANQFSSQEILKWLNVFYARFFSQQFKRNAMPDGPKIGSVALSPRGDWRMPADASPAVWKAELERIQNAQSQP